MSKGWIVVKFDGSTKATVVETFEEKCEAQDKAVELNLTAPEGVTYGWEMNK
jgi:hypothetical protein